MCEIQGTKADIVFAEKITSGAVNLALCTSAIFDFIYADTLITYKIRLRRSIDFFDKQFSVAGDGF